MVRKVNEMKLIPLTQGYQAIVDDDDYERAMKHNWNAVVDRRSERHGKVYAVRGIYNSKTKKIKREWLHKFILKAGDNVTVDHKDGNELDCRKDNLRLATQSQQTINRSIPSGISGFRGVCYKHETDKWLAQIGVDGKRFHIGYFNNKIDAAKAYDQAALKYHGEFAILNFPIESTG